MSLDAIRGLFDQGAIVPYLGPGVLPADAPCPVTSAQLVARMTAKAAVPGRIRHDLTAAAQYIESRRHRKTLEKLLDGLFAQDPAAPDLHRWLAGRADLPLVVDVWYDGTMADTLRAAGRPFVQLQGLSHPQSTGAWVDVLDQDDQAVDVGMAGPTVLYKPLGAARPNGNYLISDSDLVEVLTEIDIQSPIPEVVRQRRSDRSFLFLGCRFDGELSRTFARQIMKRSSDRHFAVIEGELTSKEARFLDRQGIVRLDMPLGDFVTGLTGGEVQALSA